MDDRIWKPGSPLARIHETHRSNTPEEFAAALLADTNFIEGDVRVQDGQAVMAHWQGDKGLTLRQWLQAAVPTGKGLKLDLKEREAFAPMLRMVRQYDHLEDRIMFNIPIGPDGLDRRQIQRLDLEFPKSIKSLSQGYAGLDGKYTEEQIQEFIKAAKIVNDRSKVSFALEAKAASVENVEELNKYGNVSVWNIPEFTPNYSADDIEKDTEHLRDIGVYGAIDLRPGAFAKPGLRDVKESPAIDIVEKVLGVDVDGPAGL